MRDLCCASLLYRGFDTVQLAAIAFLRRQHVIAALQIEPEFRLFH